MFPIVEVFTILNSNYEGKHLVKLQLRKIKSLTFLLLILASTIVTLSFLSRVKAETEIISMAPSSGYVGTSVQLGGNISTSNGQYILQFDEIEITSGNATGYEVNVAFNVTSTFVGDYTFAGDHNVTLIDVTAGENDTTTFTVLTLYSLKIDVPEPPKQLQEGDLVPISVNITGGESSKTYVANITVQASTNVSYTNMLNITTAENGSACVNLTYPKDFPTDANTNFTGEYKIFFNTTLATEHFTIGLTNSTEYHRFQFVDIKVAGYKPYENVTMTISFQEEIIDSEENITATEGCMIYTNWTVFSNASIGIYTINITSTSLNQTTKNPPDIQKFTVPGFAINITTTNLAEKPVPEVTVQVFEEGKPVVNGTSAADALVTLMLEIGNYTCDAYFRGKNVGEHFPVNVTGAGSWDFLCNLTSLGVVVEDEAGNRILEAELHLTPENQTLTTDINGVAFVLSLLPNINYTLNASRYDIQFNTTTIPQLPTTAWVNITIICPTATLQVYVTDGQNQPIIESLTVRAQELMGGLYYENNTIDGRTILHCTIGIYQIEVYAKRDNSYVKLNETTVYLFQERQNKSISCKLYGLNVSIKVVDYFGQPIPDANVMLQREGLQYSPSTESNGMVAFSNIIGGDLQITVYLHEQAQPFMVTTSFVDESTTIEIKIGKYVIIAGFLVETGQLITAVIIVAAIILILSIEIYRRKHLKSQKSVS